MEHSNESCKIDTAMQDWSQLLAHANKALQDKTWELPTAHLFQRILAYINKPSERDIWQKNYNALCGPSSNAQARHIPFLFHTQVRTETHPLILYCFRHGRFSFAT